VLFSPSPVFSFTFSLIPYLSPFCAWHLHGIKLIKKIPRALIVRVYIRIRGARLDIGKRNAVRGLGDLAGRVGFREGREVKLLGGMGIRGKDQKNTNRKN